VGDSVLPIASLSERVAALNKLHEVALYALFKGMVFRFLRRGAGFAVRSDTDRPFLRFIVVWFGRFVTAISRAEP
jgi:hypothetical protein